MKIAVFGANGQLGSDIVKLLEKNHEVTKLTHADADLGDGAAILNILNSINPDAIINTAAFHHAEQCEQDPQKAESINVLAPSIMAEYAATHHAKFIHFSTDYVFDGNQHKPYIETDQAKPLNVYGQSKLKGEQQVLSKNPEAVVMRVSGLYGMSPCRAKNGLNFVQLMLKLAKEKGEVKVVDDEFVSPTYTRNIAEQVEKILHSNISGIVHSTSEGSCSWNQFANEIFTRTGTQVILHKAVSADFPAKVPRPHYSVLENAKLKEAGINVMLPWQEALQQYLDEMQEISA